MRALDGAPRGAPLRQAISRATPAAEAVAAAAAQAARRRRPSTPRGAAACRRASAARAAPRRAPPRLEWPRCRWSARAAAGSRRPRARSRRRPALNRARGSPAAAARSRRGRRSQSRGRSSSSRPARARAPRFARAAAVPRSGFARNSSPPRRWSWFHDCWLRRTIQCRSAVLLRSQRINAAGALPRDAVCCLSTDGVFVRCRSARGRAALPMLLLKLVLSIPVRCDPHGGVALLTVRGELPRRFCLDGSMLLCEARPGPPPANRRRAVSPSPTYP